MKNIIIFSFIFILFLTGCDKNDQNYEYYKPQTQLCEKYLKSGSIPLGKLKWITETDAPISTSAALSNNKLAFINNHGFIYLLNASNVNKLWKKTIQIPQLTENNSIEIQKIKLLCLFYFLMTQIN